MKHKKNHTLLLGNGRDELLTIPEIADELLLRNYPMLIDFDGNRRLVIFVPDWYLTRLPEYVDPSRGRELQNYSAQVTGQCPERKKYFEDLRNFYMCGERKYG